MALAVPQAWFPHIRAVFSSALVKYSGYLEHMDKPFDSNCFRKTPRLMKLGEGKVTWGHLGKRGHVLRLSQHPGNRFLEFVAELGFQGSTQVVLSLFFLRHYFWLVAYLASLSWHLSCPLGAIKIFMYMCICAQCLQRPEEGGKPPGTVIRQLLPP